MGYAIMQILAADGVTYKDWNGQLVALPDGTLGSVVVKKALEQHVQRDQGIDVVIGTNNAAVIATHAVPVGQMHKVWAYALTADSSMVDSFQVKVAGTAKTKVYTGTYHGGLLEDYVLIDNTTGGAPVAVTLEAHNNDPVNQHHASGYVLSEDITLQQAPTN
jgi:hypothetical protein